MQAYAACPHCSHPLPESVRTLSQSDQTACSACKKRFKVSAAIDFARKNYITHKVEEFEPELEPLAGKQTCQFCLSEVPVGASKCSNCGEWLTTSTRQIARAQLRSPGLAAALNFIIPGLGHFYAERVASGVVWFFLIFSCYFLGFTFLPCVASLAAVSFHIWCMVDAHKIVSNSQANLTD